MYYYIDSYIVQAARSAENFEVYYSTNRNCSRSHPEAVEEYSSNSLHTDSRRPDDNVGIEDGQESRKKQE